MRTTNASNALFATNLALLIVVSNMLTAASITGDSTTTARTEERDHELPVEFGTVQGGDTNINRATRSGRTEPNPAQSSRSLADWLQETEEDQITSGELTLTGKATREPTLIRSYLAAPSNDYRVYSAVTNEQPFSSSSSTSTIDTLGPALTRLLESVIGSNESRSGHYKNMMNLSLNNKRKRTCLINSGLSHDCDMKDFLAALSYRRMWDSPSSPGK